jgi:hypothetical protein
MMNLSRHATSLPVDKMISQDSYSGQSAFAQALITLFPPPPFDGVLSRSVQGDQS